jgi:hypothetical protein
MLLTYISDISVGNHLPYRISMALKLTLCFPFFFRIANFFFFSFFSSATTICVSFFLDCVTLPPSLSLFPLLYFLYFLAGLGFFYVDFKGSDQ